jgi:hypothetical protein
VAADRAGTLGFDFLAYHQAANRVLAGERLYDPTIQQTGGFGLFYYPPPFALAIVPLALLPGPTAVWLWAGLSMVAFLAGVALLPIRRDVRWLIVLLAALSWPFAYAFKLGQVGPLLFLLFAIGWRWLDEPRAMGASAAIGALIKLQPGLLLGWAILTRRWLAAAIGVAILIVAVLAATIVAGGPTVWTDFASLLRNVSDPNTTPHNFTPGAVAYQLGATAAAAVAIQVASTVLAVTVAVVVALRAPAAASYLAAVTASQLVSPVLWDHYAMLLLLPVAWLLARGHWWAVAIPLATSILTFDLVPAAVYPIAFWVTLTAVAGIGLREGQTGRRSRRPSAGAPPAGVAG